LHELGDEQKSRWREHIKSYYMRYFASRLGMFALRCFGIYVSATAISLMAAHIFLIMWPKSEWAGRIVAPVARGLEFLDMHWKAVLFLRVSG
jgi:hypothetical protein